MRKKPLAMRKISEKKSPTLILCFILLTVLFCSLGHVESAPSPFTGSIRITPEGTVEGTDKITRNDNVYTLNGDLSGGVDNGRAFVSIERDGVIFDGGGQTIQGTGTGVAITARGRADITIKNTRILNFGTGIELRARDFQSNSSATNNRIIDNYLETAYWGIDLNTVNGFVSGNTIVSKSSIYGVNFQSNSTVFSNNAFTNGGLILLSPGSQNIFSGNTINGKPLICLEGQANQVVDGANQVILVNCHDITIKNIDNTVDLRVTIQLFGTSNTRITNCKGNIALSNSHSNTIFRNELSEVGTTANYHSSVIELTASNNNSIVQNSILATNCYGISLIGSSYTNIEANNIITSGSGEAAIRIETQSKSPSEYNYIYENSITSKESGLYLRMGARNNFVFKNSIYGCKNAVMLSSAYKNSFIGNNISASTQYGIYLYISDNNSFFQNNLVNNAKQAYESHELYYWAIGNNTYYSENNMWDNGKEGNYWSDYKGSDANGDGIGETPYVVYENFTDKYPLTTPFNIESVRVNFVEWVPTFTTQPAISPESSQSESFPVLVVMVVAVAVAAMVLAVGLLVFNKRRSQSHLVKKP